MKHEYVIGLLAAVLLILAVAPVVVAGEAEIKLPARGVIINPSRKNIVIRKDPPKVSAFSYKLADKICSVGVGTIFEAMKEERIVNGEVWYRVRIDRRAVRNPSAEWDGGDIDGWMAGRIRNTWVVSFEREDIKHYMGFTTAIRLPKTSSGPEEDRATGEETVETVVEEPVPEEVAVSERPSGSEDDTAGTVGTEPPTEDEPDTAVIDAAGPIHGTGEHVDPDQGGFSFLLRYLLLLLGSCAAVVVLAIERSQSLNIKKWFSPIIPFEFLVLGLANIIFVALLLNTFIKKSESSVVFECITVFAGPNFGFIFLGFIVSVLLSKFMAFAKK